MTEFGRFGGRLAGRLAAGIVAADVVEVASGRAKSTSWSGVACGWRCWRRRFGFGGRGSRWTDPAGAVLGRGSGRRK